MTFVADILLMALLIVALVAAQRMSAPRGKSPDATPKSTGHSRANAGVTKPERPRRLTTRQLAPIAAALSFFIPGLGHFLISAWTRGLIYLAGFFAIGALSGPSRTPLPFALMVVAAIDAYLTARWTEPDDRGGTKSTHEQRPDAH